MDNPGGVVVPIEPMSEGDLAEVDPWQLLAQGAGVVITWDELSRDRADYWGPTLQATSALAQQLTTVATRAGHSTLAGASTLFRVEVPTGATLQSLVPAVGGGFRGLVRAGESTKIAGQARLIPVAGAGAAAGVGIAMGPLIALMALSVGTEMLAAHQQNKKLGAIKHGVEALGRAADEIAAAQLNGAQQALELATAAILDKIEVPQSVALGPACNDLRTIKNRALNWLEGWEHRAESIDHSGTGIPYGKMRELLAGPGTGEDEYLKFPRQIETLYRALALDSRASVVTAAEAALRAPDEKMHHLQQQIRSALGKNAEAQDRLRDLLWTIAEFPVTSPFPAMTPAGRRVAALDRTLSRLAAAASRLPDAPAMLTPANRQVLEVAREPSGDIRVLKPAA